MDPPTQKIKIAICGGGIAGLCLLYGLSRHPNLDVTLYEASPEIAGDVGSGVGLAPNAMRALNIIGAPLVLAVKDAESVEVENPYASVMMLHSVSPDKALPKVDRYRSRPTETDANGTYQGCGPRVGEHITYLASKHHEPGYLFQRSKFIEQLFKLVNPARCKTNKKLADVRSISEGDHRLELQFTDGTSEQVDGVMGGDGVHSTVRRYVLQHYPQEIAPIFSKSYMYGAMVPMEDAREEVGNPEFVDSMQYAWVGDRAFLMHDPSNNKQTLQLVAAIRTDEVWTEDQWVKEKTADEISADLEGMGELGKAFVKLISQQDGPILARSIWEHPRASTYNLGRAALLGDAAHAMLPWQAAGASQAIEDAMIMITLFDQISSSDDVPKVFEAYTATRKERTHYAQNMSAENGDIVLGLHPDAGLDVERLHDIFQPRWDELWYCDLEKHRRDALANMEAVKASA